MSQLVGVGQAVPSAGPDYLSATRRCRDRAAGLADVTDLT